MKYDGTITLSEDKIKDIIKQHLESEGYTISDNEDAVNFKIAAGHDGGRFGGYTPPKFRKATVKIKI